MKKTNASPNGFNSPGFRTPIHIIKLLICFIVSFSLTIAVTYSFGLDIPYATAVGVILVCMLVLSLTLYNKLTLNITLFIIVLGIAVITYLHNETDRLDEIREEVFLFSDRFIKWLVNYYMAGTPRNPEYESYVFTAICVFITLLAFIFTVKKFVFTVLFAGGFAVFCVQWSLGLSVNYAAFYTIVSTVVFSYVFHVYCKNAEDPDSAGYSSAGYSRAGSSGAGSSGAGSGGTGFSSAGYGSAGSSGAGSGGTGSNGIFSPLRFLLYALPVILMAILLTNALPAPDSPIRWEWLYERVDQASSFYRDNYIFHTVDNYALNTTGFSEGESFLSGPVRINYTPVLAVRTENPSIYLKGNGKSEYTGNSWKSAETNTTATEVFSEGSEILRDNDEFRSSILIFLFRQASAGGYEARGIPNSRAAIEESVDSLLDKGRETVSIAYNRLRTRSAFIPLKTKEFRMLSPGGGTVFEKDGAVIMENRVSEGFTYDVDYLREESLQLSDRMAQNSYRGLYDDLLAVYDTASAMVYPPRRRRPEPGGTVTPNEENATNAPNVSYTVESIDAGGTGTVITVVNDGEVVLQNTDGYDVYLVSTMGYRHVSLKDFIDKEELFALKENAEKIRAEYLTLPETLPERVKELAVELTKDIEYDYDKIKKFELFLGSSYSYTLDTSFLVPGEDFVDNFLFEMKSGYCTHFASAMAIMARCIGLPSRYVEGYVMPTGTIDKNTYLVTNAQAHAWVEIYFEGYGWKMVEPTAPFREIYRRQEEAVEDVGGLNDFGEDEYSDLIAQFMDNDGMEDIDTNGLDGDGQPDDGQQALSDSDNGLLSIIAANPLWALLVALAIVALFFVAFAHIRRHRRKKRFETEPGKASRLIFAHCVKVLSLMGAGIVDSETPRQFAVRVEGAYRFKDSVFLRASEVFSKACYSPHAIKEEERHLVYSAYAELSQIFSSRCGIIKRLLFKTFLAAV